MLDVPSGWSTARLGEVAKLYSSHVDKKSHPNELSVLLCNYKDVYHNETITDNLAFMRASATPREIARFSLQAGDILITRDSESPRDIAVSAYVAQIADGVLCGYHLALIRPIAQVLGSYLHQFLGLQQTRTYFYLRANGITRFGLTQSVIQQMPVVYPPLAEQRRIVAVLNTVDRLIALTEAQCKKLQALKTGLFQTLLQQTTVKESDADTLPPGWHRRCLGDVVTLAYGKTCVTPMQPYGRYPALGSNGVIGYTQDYLCEGATVVLGRKGTINKPHYIEEKCWVIDTAYYLTDYQDVYPRWLYYVLVAMDLTLFNEATGIPSLSRETVYKIAYKHPPLAEQKKMTAIFWGVDQHIAACAARLQHYRRLKQALREDILTGKVRVA